MFTKQALRLAALAAAATALAGGAMAQERLADQVDLDQRPFWVQVPPSKEVLESPDMPRTADGLPDIFSEWVDHYQPLHPRGQPDRILRPEDGDLILPEDFASEEQYQAFLDRDTGTNPQITCIPPGVARVVGQPYKLEIVRSGPGAFLDKIVFLHEVEHIIRKAYFGKPIEPDVDLRPYWGTSTAEWVDASGDGKIDMLVVETEGFRGSWLEQIGFTYADGSTLREEYWLNEDGSILHLREILTDPKTYSHPIEHHIWWERANTAEKARFDEYHCAIDTAQPQRIMERYGLATTAAELEAKQPD